MLVACAGWLPAAEASFPGPNGKIAFQRADDIWTANPDGTDRRNITFSAGRVETEPAWSPDGRRLAFLRSTGGASQELITANAEGNEQRTIVVPYFGPDGACGDLLNPAWSPDGQEIAFSCTDGNDREIWTINADGSGLTRLTSEPGPLPQINEVEPAWSPDGTKIAYERMGVTSEVWTMNPDGSAKALLVTNRGSPDWAPNSSRLVLVSKGACFDPACNDLWSIDRTGANLTQLTFGASREMNPSWSPDGQRIAFTRCPDPDADPDGECRTGLFTMSADGTNVSVLVDDVTANEMSPAWQAGLPSVPAPEDPAKIVFVSHRDHHLIEGSSEIYSMNSDGSALKRLTFNYRADVNPVWSPDGNRIAFSTNRDGNYEIYTMNADGSEQLRLTNNPLSDSNPTWSPDGTRIAYIRSGSTTARIHVMNADGIEDLELPSDTNDIGDLDWSPDGSRLALHRGIDGTEGIATIAPDGSGAVQLTVGDDRSPAWSPASNKIAFSRVVAEGDGRVPKVWVMNPDGAGETQVMTGPGGWSDPTWSPDGRKIAYVGDRDIYVANSDGTGRVNLNNDAFFDTQPDWRDPTAGYPEPRGASPLRVSLVTAYGQCGGPDRMHGPPLAFPSCSGPRASSDYLTVGTGDANGRPARHDGYLRVNVVPGDPETPVDEADVGLTLFADDIFTKALGDYTGEVRARLTIRITDRANTPAPGGRNAGTVSDLTIAFDADCTAVADPQAGSTCSASTTVDALVPGAVREGMRGIWALDAVRLFDGGADGDGDTAGDNTLFATQGVFIP